MRRTEGQGRKNHRAVLKAYLGGKKPREKSLRIRAHLHTEVCVYYRAGVEGRKVENFPV